MDLDLSNNTIGSLEFKKIADALVTNRTLTSLNISFNPKISQDSLTALLTPLANNANLVLAKLFMDGCNLGNEGAKKVGLFRSFVRSFVHSFALLTCFSLLLDWRHVVKQLHP